MKVINGRMYGYEQLCFSSFDVDDGQEASVWYSTTPEQGPLRCNARGCVGVWRACYISLVAVCSISRFWRYILYSCMYAKYPEMDFA
jgi:hypothetical protein